MTKPELLLHYTLIDEGVPLITDGIVLEINRRQVKEPIRFIGMEKTMPVQLQPVWGRSPELIRWIFCGAAFINRRRIHPVCSWRRR